MDVTALLNRWSEGDSSALEQLTPIVYAELRRIAGHQLRRDAGARTLESAALVHEAYLRLVGQNAAHWHGRAHFLAVASQIMRRILVDHARKRHRLKRGGPIQIVTLNPEMDVADSRGVDLIGLDDALETLAAMDPRQSRLVELRFFAGLSIDDAAQVMGLSKATVNRDWVTARAWLLRQLRRARGTSAGAGYQV
jgi:RNA polymerase sigma factor (TIGR02999 family)